MKATRASVFTFELTEAEAMALFLALADEVAPDKAIVDRFYGLLSQIVPHQERDPKGSWPARVDHPTPRGLVADLEVED